nr:immunoglobulin heavy chain junction region [Mus musculus]MBK4184096.1 immunoglobulin heavy chain junction region [Mus musculus]
CARSIYYGNPWFAYW